MVDIIDMVEIFLFLWIQISYNPSFNLLSHSEHVCSLLIISYCIIMNLQESHFSGPLSLSLSLCVSLTVSICLLGCHFLTLDVLSLNICLHNSCSQKCGYIHLLFFLSFFLSCHFCNQLSTSVMSFFYLLVVCFLFTLFLLITFVGIIKFFDLFVHLFLYTILTLSIFTFFLLCSFLIHHIVWLNERIAVSSWLGASMKITFKDGWLENSWNSEIVKNSSSSSSSNIFCKIT